MIGADVWIAVVAVPLIVVGVGVLVYWVNRISDPDEGVR